MRLRVQLHKTLPSIVALAASAAMFGCASDSGNGDSTGSGAASDVPASNAPAMVTELPSPAGAGAAKPNSKRAKCWNIQLGISNSNS